MINNFLGTKICIQHKLKYKYSQLRQLLSHRITAHKQVGVLVCIHVWWRPKFTLKSYSILWPHPIFTPDDKSIKHC